LVKHTETNVEHDFFLFSVSIITIMIFPSRLKRALDER